MEVKVSKELATELNSSTKIKIKNLMSYAVGFPGHTINADKGHCIEGNMQIKLPLGEVEDQIDYNNVLFCGLDGNGSHAVLQIVEPEIRKLLFESEEEPIQLTNERIEALLNKEDYDDFVKSMETLIVTESEARETLHRITIGKIDISKQIGWKSSTLNEYCTNLILKKYPEEFRKQIKNNTLVNQI